MRYLRIIIAGFAVTFILISAIWYIKEPDFEPALVYLGAIFSVLAFFYESICKEIEDRRVKFKRSWRKRELERLMKRSEYQPDRRRLFRARIRIFEEASPKFNKFVRKALSGRSKNKAEKQYDLAAIHKL